MNKFKIALSVLVVAVLASGCPGTHYPNEANRYTIERVSPIGKYTKGHKDIKDGAAIHLDAEQRLVFSKKEMDDEGKTITKICAEPSPDAITAFSSSFARSLSTSFKDKARFEDKIASALAKSSASIGIRTQSIQLMRDALYRTCEAYFSGAIDEKQFHELHEQFQDVMVGVLAIEQLTGAVAAPAVVLGQDVTVDSGANSSKIETPSKQINVTVHKQDASKVADAVTEIVDRVLLSRDIRQCLEREEWNKRQSSTANSGEAVVSLSLGTGGITGQLAIVTNSANATQFYTSPIANQFVNIATSIANSVASTSKENDNICAAIKSRIENKKTKQRNSGFFFLF